MSDALTDIARSERINRYWVRLYDAEKEFLIKPTKVKLDNIYEACDLLVTAPGGYWGETGGFAKKIREYYQIRFEGKKRFVIESDDIAYVLEQVNKDYRLIELADLITGAQLIKREIKGYKDLKEYHDKLGENFDYVKSHLTVAQEGQLESKLSGEQFENILEESKIRDIFPIKYKSRKE